MSTSWTTSEGISASSLAHDQDHQHHQDQNYLSGPYSYPTGNMDQNPTLADHLQAMKTYFDGCAEIVEEPPSTVAVGVAFGTLLKVPGVNYPSTVFCYALPFEDIPDVPRSAEFGMGAASAMTGEEVSIPSDTTSTYYDIQNLIIPRAGNFFFRLTLGLMDFTTGRIDYFAAIDTRRIVAIANQQG